MRQQDPQPRTKVKNTFLEVSLDQEPAVGETRGRRSRSDVDHRHASPLVVASKSPNASPGLHPVDETMQAVPIDEVDFELLEEAEPMEGAYRYGEGTVGPEQTPAMVAQQTPGLGPNEPAYVVPTTPSPFLHSAFPPTNVPPFAYSAGMGGYGMPDMGLPPAYGTEGDAGGQDGVPGQYMQDADGNVQNPYMQGNMGMQYMHPDMYNQYMPFGWTGMPMDGSGGYGMPHMEGGVGPDGQFHPGFAGHGQLDQAHQDASFAEGFAAARGDLQGIAPGQMQDMGDAGRKEGRRGKGRKKEALAEEKAAAAMAATVSAGGRDRDQKAPPQGKAGDLASADAANKAAMEADEEYTTVMLRNIPNKYTREMLIKQLSVDFHGLYDFMYLPIDFKNKCNVGYGFINFRNQDACEQFVTNFHGVDVRKCLPGLNSRKVVEVTPARVQGLIENVRRLRNSPVMNQLQDHPEWMPLLFNERGVEEPFPSPDQVLPPVKPRGRARVEGQAA